jgi:hypothetical protein
MHTSFVPTKQKENYKIIYKNKEGKKMKRKKKKL